MIHGFTFVTEGKKVLLILVQVLLGTSNAFISRYLLSISKELAS